MKEYCFLDTYHYPDCDFHQQKEILEQAGYCFRMGNCRTEDEVVEFAANAEVVCTGYVPITESLLARLPKLKAAIRFGIGYDCVDLDACTRHGVWCCNLPTYCLEDVATMAIAMMLDLLRKVTMFDRSCRRGEWNVGYGKYPARRMSSMTVGLIGFGNIARTTFGLLKGFNCHIIAYDPFLPDEKFAEFGCERVTLDELYARADIISMHVPANKDTQHMINAEAISRMKDGVLFVNTSRGAIVNQNDLIEGCKSGKIAGAALDVLEYEPVTDKLHPLYFCDNIIVTPHVSYNTVEASDAMHIQAAETAVNVMNGQIPQNRVNMR